MTTNVNAFLHSVCLAVATATSLEYTGSVRALFRNRADEKFASDPYSVLILPPGPALDGDPLPMANVQVVTVGTSDEAALAQAQRVFERFQDAEGVPARMRQVDAVTTADVPDGTWRITRADALQRPGVVGIDERGRGRVVFNVRLDFFKE